jgi:hypothetical protein
MLAPFFWFKGLLGAGAARDLQSRAFILEFLISCGSNLLFFTQIRTEKTR